MPDLVPQETPQVVHPALAADDALGRLAAGWLLGFGSVNTRNAYRRDLADLAAFLSDEDVPIVAAERAHLEAWARVMEQDGRRPATVARKLAAVASFYRYAVEEGAIATNPAERVRRPRVPADSPTLGLDRDEARAFLDAATPDPRDAALAALLVHNGLRVSEACAATIADLGTERGHRVLAVTRKRGGRELVPLAPTTMAMITTYIGERTAGPIFLDGDGGPLDRHDASRIVARLAKAAGIDKAITPHSLRHTAVTLALDAGASLRDVQDLAGHADPRTTRRYDRARKSLDRHATYTVARYLA